MKLNVESDGALWSSIPATGGRPPAISQTGDVTLDIQVSQQRHSRWCWAAIGSALRDFFGAAPLSQDAVAKAVLPPETQDPNVNLRLDLVLRTLGCYGHWSPGRPTFDRIIFEISRGFPLCPRIEWAGGDAHYVMVTGFHRDRKEILLEDSLNGPSRQRFDDFPGLYRQHGSVWSETFWTNFTGET